MLLFVCASGSRWTIRLWRWMGRVSWVSPRALLPPSSGTHQEWSGKTHTNTQTDSKMHIWVSCLVKFIWFDLIYFLDREVKHSLKLLLCIKYRFLPNKYASWHSDAHSVSSSNEPNFHRSLSEISILGPTKNVLLIQPWSVTFNQNF